MYKMYRKFAISLGILFFLTGPFNIAFSQRDEPVLGKGQILTVPDRIESRIFSLYEMIPSDLVYEETFESGKNSWTSSGGTEIGSPTSGPGRGYLSSSCAASNLAGSYADGADGLLMSPVIRLPQYTPGSQLTMTFHEWFEIESGWDQGRVEISTDSGSTWKLLSARSGQSGWRETSVDLSAYAGQSIHMGFHFTSDPANSYAGWYIDDVKITRLEPQQLGASLINLNPQNFPFIYMNVSVTRDGDPLPTLDQSNFSVYENKIGEAPVLQTGNFKVTPPDQGGGSRLADVIFLMDNSGSMQEEINAISNNVIAFVNGLTGSGVDFRLGLCRFGDAGNSGYPIIEDGGQLTDDAEYFKNSVWTRNVTDGGFEPGWDALYQSATSFSFRPGSQKVFILITDETVTGDGNLGQYSKSQAISILQSNSVTTFALVNTSDPNAQTDYCEITDATNGSCFDITSPFDEILDFITEQVSGTYLVQYKSSQPEADGEERQVQVHVTDAGETEIVEGSYIPGAAPKIQRTAATLALHNQDWDEETPFTIEAEIKDEADPDVENATVFYRTTGETVYNAAGMSEFSEDIYRGTIPGTAVHTPGLEYYISATDGVSTSSDPSVDPTTRPYVIGILPNEVPEIIHTPVTTMVIGQEVAIDAAIRDETNQLDIAQLSYRVRGDLLYASVDMTNQGGDQYQSGIPGTYAKEDGVEYYIYAEDDFGVGAYDGTPDNPHLIEGDSEFAAYLTLKQLLISEILGLNRPFYGTSNPFANIAEQRASLLLTEIQQKYDDDEATGKELEAIARLTLSERVAKEAFSGGIVISQWGAKGMNALTFSFVCSAAFKRLLPTTKWLATNLPKLGGVRVHQTMLKLITKFDTIITRLMLRFQNALQNTAAGYTAGQWQAAQAATQIGLSKAAGRTTRSIAALGDDKLGTGWFDFFEHVVQDYVFLNPLDVLTNASQKAAVSHAQNLYFPEDLFDQANADATHTLNTLITANAVANNVGNYAETTRQVAIVATLVGALGLVIVGIIGAPVSGGLSIVAVIAGLSTILTTYGSLVSTSAAIGEAVYVGSHLYLAVPYLAVNPAVDHAFSLSSGPLSEEGKPPSRPASGVRSHSPQGVNSARPDHAEQVQDYYQRLRDMIVSGDTTWASTGIDSLNYYEDLARQDEDLTIADFLASSDSAHTVISSYDNMVASYIRRAVTRDIYSAVLDINGLVHGLGMGDLTTVNEAIAVLDSTMANFTQLVTTRLGVYDSLQTYSVPTPTAVGIGAIEIKPVETETNNATLEVKVINYGPGTSEWVHVYPILGDENAQVLGDSLFLVTLSAGDTVLVEFEVSSPDSFIDGSVMLAADSLAAEYYTMPGKNFTIELSSGTPPTGSSLSNEAVYAYPNPFNPDVEEVRFRFRLAEAGNVTIKVYDVSNKLVKTVISKMPMSAETELEESWDGKNEIGSVVANGVYFYVIESSSGERAVGKVAILR